jgi:uncharacterized protein RhaS with RHS repeats
MNAYTKEYISTEGKTIEVYNSKDKVIETTTFDTDGTFVSKVIYQYNKEGNNTSRLIYHDDSEKPYWRLEFDYDDAGNRLEDRELDSEGRLVYRNSYEYDRPDGKIKVTSYDRDAKLTGEKLEDFI